MIIYKCLVSGDEMFSDIYKITTTDDGLFYEVEGKCISRKVGEIDDSLIGGNASAEDAGEGCDCSSESGVDIVLNHKLNSIPQFDKKTFVAYLKPHLKALKAKVEEMDPSKVAAFQEEAQKGGKKMLDMVSKNKEKQEIDYYTGESLNAEGAVGFLDFRADGITPFMVFLKCALETEKC